MTGGAGDAVKNVTGGAGDALEDVTKGGVGGVLEDVTNGAGGALENVTGGVGGGLGDVTGGVGGVLEDVTNGAGGALKDVTNGAPGGVGPVLNEVTDPVGDAGDNASVLPGTSVAGVTPETDDSSRPTVGGSRLDGNSMSVSQRVSENPFSMVSDDLPAVVQAPGSALGDSVASPGDASAGSFELPFGLGTLPFTGVELALIMLVALTTACVGWVMVRFTGIIEARA